MEPQFNEIAFDAKFRRFCEIQRTQSPKAAILSEPVFPRFQSLFHKYEMTSSNYSKKSRINVNLFGKALLRGIRFYRLLSSRRAPVCRFDPTCSQYAIDAIEAHGAVRGTPFVMRRIMRCHPWGGQGYDPVPTRAREGEVQCST